MFMRYALFIPFMARVIRASSIASGESSTVFIMAAFTSAAASFSIARRDASSCARRANSAFLSSAASLLFASARVSPQALSRLALGLLQDLERRHFPLLLSSLCRSDRLPVISCPPPRLLRAPLRSFPFFYGEGREVVCKQQGEE